uniref:Uncharacterized protein n=1 Tax=Anguilla anguilla TaxID=7936 RepID=A0A0E9S604_ANGAN
MYTGTGVRISHMYISTRAHLPGYH